MNRSMSTALTVGERGLVARASPAVPGWAPSCPASPVGQGARPRGRASPAEQGCSLEVMLPGAQVVTPEAVVLDLPTASVGSRPLCRLLDVLLTLVSLFVLLIVLSVAAGLSSSGGVVVLIVYLVGLLGVLVLYPALMEGLWGGRTVGKLVLGLRVVRTDGGPIGFSQAAVRARSAWWRCGDAGGAGHHMYLRVRQRPAPRRHGGRNRRPARTPWGSPPSGERAGPARVRTAGADNGCRGHEPHDYELVRSFLVRWREFGDPQRRVLAANLAGPLWQRFRHPLPAGLGPDYYLACLGAAYQFRHPAHVPAPVPSNQPPSWGSPAGGDAATAPQGWESVTAPSSPSAAGAPAWGNGNSVAEPGANGWSAPG